MSLLDLFFIKNLSVLTRELYFVIPNRREESHKHLHKQMSHIRST